MSEEGKENLIVSFSPPSPQEKEGGKPPLMERWIAAAYLYLDSLPTEQKALVETWKSVKPAIREEIKSWVKEEKARLYGQGESSSSGSSHKNFFSLFFPPFLLKAFNEVEEMAQKLSPEELKKIIEKTMERARSPQGMLTSQEKQLLLSFLKAQTWYRLVIYGFTNPVLRRLEGRTKKGKEEKRRAKGAKRLYQALRDLSSY